MQQLAYFSFRGNLNDFLLKRYRDTIITYSFNGSPALKDAIEAIGIPHVEVVWILTNNRQTQFNTPLLPGDVVEVYPFNIPPKGDPAAVRDKQSMPRAFVLDVHLGALARLLRLLGIDTYYETSCTDKELATIAQAQHRAVLTRDVALLKQKIIEWGSWLRSQDPHEQLLEVVHRYGLSPHFKPFTRCMACNGLIFPVEKQQVLSVIPQGTKQYFQEFYQCDQCKKVYWKGSHYERMQEFVNRLKERANNL